MAQPAISQLPARDPWVPPFHEEFHAEAIRAVAEGRASEHQQKLAMAWIIFRACATYDLSWRPGGVDGQRATDLAEGRRFVGLSIIKLIKSNMQTKAIA